MSSQLPPCSDTSIVSSSNTRRGGQGGTTRTPSSSKEHRSNTSISASSTDENGRKELEARLRSISSHPWGLALAFALHGCDDQSICNYFNFASDHPFPDETQTALNNVLVRAFYKMMSHEKEARLTEAMSEQIDMHHAKTNFRSVNEVTVNCSPPISSYGSVIKKVVDGKVDIVLSESADRKDAIVTSPFALIEVGLDNFFWWKKFDQNLKYIDGLYEHKQKDDQEQKLREPVICAVLTIDGDVINNLKIKFGVFLCWPKAESKCRMAHLWHAFTTDLEAASEAFGRFLWVVSLFAKYRRSGEDKTPTYQYLSSNCCRIGNHVVRSYDTRFRKTCRSFEIYEDPEIVGDMEVIMDIPASEGSTTEEADCDSYFWLMLGFLKMIAIPFKPGHHDARTPLEFLPIIQHLEWLHSRGYVHGDIRAFNVVLAGKNAGDEVAGLIDFDLGGKAGKKKYPKGYRRELPDGDRIGDGDSADSNKNTLQYFHDWYALGKLMFFIHIFTPPAKDVMELTLSEEIEQLKWTATAKDVMQYWTTLKSQPSSEDITQLKILLPELHDRKWSVSPNANFEEQLEQFGIGGMTHVGATGTPLRNK